MGAGQPLGGGVSSFMLNLGPFRLKTVPEGEKRPARVGPARAGPTLNPGQGGDESRQRQPRLIGGWTAPGRAELGRSGLIRALLDLRLSLR